MKNWFKSCSGLIRIGIDSFRQEGIGNFVKKCVGWFRQYISWRKRIIKRALRDDLEWYVFCRIGIFRKMFNLRRNRRYYKVYGGLEYGIKENLEHKIISNGEISYIVDSEIFERAGETIHQHSSHPIYWVEFRQTDVYGSSEVFTIGKAAISDAFVRDIHSKRYNMAYGVILRHKSGKYLLVSYNDLGRVVEKAIMMVGGYGNYYHFTFEIMSRLPFVDQEEKYRDWPIMIDKCVMETPSLWELLNCMNIYHHEIITVEKYEKIRVNNMLYVSPTMWVPLNFRSGAEMYPFDFMLTTYTVNNVRNTVLQKINTDGALDKKIYLSRRKCANVRLINGEEVERIFAKSGFRIICPEELSFEE